MPFEPFLYPACPMGHRAALRVPVLALILAAACGGDDAPLESYELTGYVRDDLTDAPLEGARVVFTSDTLYTAEGTTDSDGLYEMVIASDVPFGQVRAERSGYRPAERTVFFDQAVRRVDLRLRPASEPPAM